MVNLHRRGVLALGSSVVLVTIAGCNGDLPIGPDEETQVLLKNETDEEKAITLTLERRADGEQLLDETVTLDGEESRGLSDLVDDGAVDVTVRVEGGPEETYEWTETGSGNVLRIGIDTASIAFTVATPR